MDLRPNRITIDVYFCSRRLIAPECAPGERRRSYSIEDRVISVSLCFVGKSDPKSLEVTRALPVRNSDSQTHLHFRGDYTIFSFGFHIGLNESQDCRTSNHKCLGERLDVRE